MIGDRIYIGWNVMTRTYDSCFRSYLASCFSPFVISVERQDFIRESEYVAFLSIIECIRTVSDSLLWIYACCFTSKYRLSYLRAKQSKMKLRTIIDSSTNRDFLRAISLPSEICTMQNALFTGRGHTMIKSSHLVASTRLSFLWANGTSSKEKHLFFAT